MKHDRYTRALDHFPTKSAFWVAFWQNFELSPQMARNLENSKTFTFFRREKKLFANGRDTNAMNFSLFFLKFCLAIFLQLSFPIIASAS